MASFQDTDADMYVTKRNQQREIMSFDKILKRIKKVGQEANIKINRVPQGARAPAIAPIEQALNKHSVT